MVQSPDRATCALACVHGAAVLPPHASFTQLCPASPLQIPYDIMVVAVGEKLATFGVKGVEEHWWAGRGWEWSPAVHPRACQAARGAACADLAVACPIRGPPPCSFFMKEIPDSVGLRQRISQQFELAALPGTKDADMRRALHFVVVGGGPTGVEFAGTLSDFLRDDLKKKYPELMPYVRVTLLNATPSILVQFDEKCEGREGARQGRRAQPWQLAARRATLILGSALAARRMRQHALDNFKRVGVDVRNDTAVVEVGKQRASRGARARHTAYIAWQHHRCLLRQARWRLVPQVTKDTIKLGTGEALPYGVCVWSAGNAPRSLTQELAAQIPEQAPYQPGGRPSKLAVDSYLR